MELENVIRERENQIIKYEINSKLDLNELEKSMQNAKELEETVKRLEEEVWIYFFFY